MKVIWKKPGRPPETAEVENTLAALQEAVGGRIETVRLAEDACIVCNEEGWLQRLPYNCRVGGMPRSRSRRRKSAGASGSSGGGSRRFRGPVRRRRSTRRSGAGGPARTAGDAGFPASFWTGTARGPGTIATTCGSVERQGPRLAMGSPARRLHRGPAGKDGGRRRKRRGNKKEEQR